MPPSGFVVDERGNRAATPGSKRIKMKTLTTLPPHELCEIRWRNGCWHVLDRRNYAVIGAFPGSPEGRTKAAEEAAWRNDLRHRETQRRRPS